MTIKELHDELEFILDEDIPSLEIYIGKKVRCIEISNTLDQPKQYWSTEVYEIESYNEYDCGCCYGFTLKGKPTENYYPNQLLVVEE